MFSKIWHGTLIAAIVMYAGNIFFATEPCERVDRSGSLIRVGATGLFFLTDNWMTPSDQVAVRKQAHSLDSWLQGVIKVTFFGKTLDCSNYKSTKKAAESQHKPASEPLEIPAASSKDNLVPTSKAVTRQPTLVEPPEPPVIINKNPFNLPSLPD